MDSIQVAVRIRPLKHSVDLLNEEESVIEVRRPSQYQHAESETSDVAPWESASASDTSSVTSSSVTRDGQCGLKPYITVMGSATPYAFDLILDEFASQEDTFSQCASHLCLAALEGFNASIFAYGQTGAGKTHTIKGSKGENKGILPRSLDYIFQHIQLKGGQLLTTANEGACPPPKSSHLDPNAGGRSSVSALLRSPGRSICPFAIFDKNGAHDPDTIYYKLSCTYLEIYQEQIYDLLADGCDNTIPLSIREDQNKGVYVEGLKEVPISSSNEAYNIFLKGEENRRVSSTKMNKASSRSHAVFTITIHSKKGNKVHSSAFHIVDLAGSERQKATEAAGERLKEAAKINGSLSVFSRVISTLSKAGEKKGDFVHYRDSKLTYLLKDAIGGNSKTVIIGAISPSDICSHETVSTLKFCRRAKHVKTKAVLNEKTENSIEELRRENMRLKRLLQSAITTSSVGTAQEDGTQNPDVQQLKYSVAALEAALLSQSQYQALHCEELHHKNKQLKSLLVEKAQCNIKLTDAAAFTDTRRGRLEEISRPANDCSPTEINSDEINQDSKPTISLNSKLSRSMSLCSDMLDDEDLKFVAVRPNKKDTSPAVRVMRTKPSVQKPRLASTNPRNNKNIDETVIHLPGRRTNRSSMSPTYVREKQNEKKRIDPPRTTQTKEKLRPRPHQKRDTANVSPKHSLQAESDKSEDNKILQEEIFHLRQLCQALRTHLKYKEPLESLPIAHIKDIQTLKDDSTLSSALSFVEQQNMLVEWLESKLDQKNHHAEGQKNASTSDADTAVSGDETSTQNSCVPSETGTAANDDPIVYRKAQTQILEHRTVTCEARLQHENHTESDARINKQPSFNRRYSLPMIPFGMMNIPRRLASYLASTKRLFAKTSQPVTSQSMIVF